MDKLLLYFFEVRDNIKLFHFQTQSYAAHKAADELEQSLSTLLDQFMEAFQGISGSRIPPVNSTIAIRTHTNDIVEYVKIFSTYLKRLELDKIVFDPGMLNILAEMTAAVDKFIYLMTFR
jgi:hypothetical protein